MNMPHNRRKPRRNEFDLSAELERHGREMGADFLESQAESLRGGSGEGTGSADPTRRATYHPGLFTQVTRTAKQRPQHYVPHGQRAAAIEAFGVSTRALKQQIDRLPGESKMTDRVLAEYNIPRPWLSDVQDSLDFDVYEAICLELGKPLGQLIDLATFNRVKNGMLDTGMSKSQIEAELDNADIRGDARVRAERSIEFVTQNPNSRFYNVSYPDRLKGSVLTVLGKIPRNTTNMNTVLHGTPVKSGTEDHGTPVKSGTEEQKKSEEETKAASNLTRNLLIVGGLSAVAIGAIIMVKRSKAGRA
jgi:hypothetical protein